jgi:hypothetical protein
MMSKVAPSQPSTMVFPVPVVCPACMPASASVFL